MSGSACAKNCLRIVIKLPLWQSLHDYQMKNLPADFSAGLIVAVLLIPQAMAYAMLAGLPPVVGLYASTFPLIAYALVGSSSHLAVGPVAIDSLLTLVALQAFAEAGTEEFIALAAVLALLIGVIQVSLGAMRFGFIVNFLSQAVIDGFTAAAAITIALSQLEPLFGIDLPPAHNILHKVWLFLHNFHDIHWLTFGLALLSFFLLLGARAICKKFPMPLVLVIIATFASYYFHLAQQGIAIVEDVPTGLPSLFLPQIDLENIQNLAGSALTLALIGFIEAIAIAKAIASKADYRINANRELVGIGLANITAAFFRGHPVSSSFSRSAMNYEAGGSSIVASLITALIISLTLLFFSQLFYHLPLAVLAALIISTVYRLIDFSELRRLFSIKRRDGWTWLITFASTLLLGVQEGILIGIIISLIFFVWRSAYPHTAEIGYLAKERAFRNILRYPEAKTYQHTLMVRPDAALYFANMRFLENWLEEHLHEDDRYLLLDFSGVNDIDAVAIDTLYKLICDYQGRNISVHICAMKGPVRDLIAKAGWSSTIQQQIHHLSLGHLLESLKLAEVSKTTLNLPPKPKSATKPSQN